MLPVVRGDRETVKQIVLYSFVLVARHRRPVRSGARSASSTSSPRSCSAPGSSGSRCGSPGTRRRAAPSLLFHYSLLYLALLFVAAAVGRGGLMLDPETERKNMLWGWGSSSSSA